MVPMIFLRAVFVAPRSEVKAQPSFDFLGRPSIFHSVVLIDHDGPTLLCVIHGCLVVQHRVKVYTNTNIFRTGAKLLQFHESPPFGLHAAFSIKLAKIVQVVNVVSVSGRTRSLASWRDPDVVDSSGFQVRKCILEAPPVLMVVWNIPFKGLLEGEDVLDPTSFSSRIEYKLSCHTCIIVKFSGVGSSPFGPFPVAPFAPASVSVLQDI